MAECRGLIDEGFDGIHVNVEPVDDGNVDFLALLRALRTAVGAERALSVSAIRPGPFCPPVRAELPLDARVLRPRRRGRRPDRGHGLRHRPADAGPLPALRRLGRRAGRRATLVGASPRARVLIGVPTYDETGLMHRGGVETPENAIPGVVAGLRGLGGGGTFEGVASYAEWTTDDGEWAAYERLWRGRGALGRRPGRSSTIWPSRICTTRDARAAPRPSRG